VAGLRPRDPRVIGGVAIAALLVALVVLSPRQTSGPAPSRSPGAVAAATPTTTLGPSAAPRPSPAPTSAAPVKLRWHYSQITADMADLAMTPQGLVAIGTQPRGGFVWTSTDGADWVVADDSVVFDGGRLLALASNAARTVAIGCQLVRIGCGRAITWTRDATAAGWSRYVVKGMAPGLQAHDIVATSSAFLAQAVDGEGRPKLFLSADGRTWAPAGIQAPDEQVARIVATDRQFIALGTDSATNSAIIWQSEDGATWKSTVLGLGEALGAAQIGDDLVVVGDLRDTGPQMWISTSGGPWANVPVRIPNSCGGGFDGIVPGGDGTLVLGACDSYLYRSLRATPTIVDVPEASTLVDGPKGFVGLGFREFVTSTIEAVNPPLDPIASIPDGNGWSAAPSLPILNPTAAAADAKGAVFVFTTVGSDGTLRVDRLDQVHQRWVRKQDVAAGIRSAKAVLGPHGLIYIVGLSVDGRQGRTVEYNPTTGAWHLRASMPTPRTGFGLATFKGSLYAFGGRISPCCQGVAGDGALAVVERFDVSANRWSSVAKMPVTDAEPGAVAAPIPVPQDPTASPTPSASPDPDSEPTLATKPGIIVFLAARAWMFDPEAATWSPGPTALSYGVTGSPVVGVDGIVRVFTCTRYDLYDPFMGHWQTGQVFDLDRCGALAVASGNQVYVLGGDYLPSPGRSVSAFFAGGG